MVSTAFLMEPFIAQVLATFIGVDKSPGFFTISGTTIIVIGIYWIDKSLREKREEENGNGEFPVIDNHSMFISYRVYS